MAGKTHWKNMGNYDYLGAYSLEGIAEEITVTVTNISQEKVTAEGGKQEVCCIAYFAEEEVSGVFIKPMVLNATNCKTIEAMYGPFIEDWVGKSLTIFATTTTLGRDIKPCLRIKNSKIAAQQQKQPSHQEEHTCSVCGKPIDNRTYNSVMKNFGVSVCSRECYNKISEKTNKEEENN